MSRRTARSILSLAVIMVASVFSPVVAVANAQLGRAPIANGEPPYWVGLSVGYVDGFAISDNASGTLWNFGSATQIRATLEKKVDAGVTAGVAGAFWTAPLTYAPALPAPGGTCSSEGCQANADASQYTVFIRGGGGPGFHGLYNIEGGVTQFSNFREQGTSAKLPPTDPGYDFTFGFGGGFAYGFSAGLGAYVSESWDFILHKQLASRTSSAPRVNVFRAGMR
jgi:hypothetical protein